MSVWFGLAIIVHQGQIIITYDLLSPHPVSIVVNLLIDLRPLILMYDFVWFSNRFRSNNWPF